MVSVAVNRHYVICGAQLNKSQTVEEFVLVSGRVKCTVRVSRWQQSRGMSTPLRRRMLRTYAILLWRSWKVWRNDQSMWLLCRTTKLQVSWMLLVFIAMFIFMLQDGVGNTSESCSTFSNPNSLICRQQGHTGSKTLLQQNYTFLN